VLLTKPYIKEPFTAFCFHEHGDIVSGVATKVYFNYDVFKVNNKDELISKIESTKNRYINMFNEKTQDTHVCYVVDFIKEGPKARGAYFICRLAPEEAQAELFEEESISMELNSYENL
jgi:hypothetical protein